MSNIEKKSVLLHWKDKLTTAEKALSHIQPGDHIFVGSACATPRNLIHTLERMNINLADVEFFHFLTDGAISREKDTSEAKIRHRVFFVGTDMKDAIKRGQADYAPSPSHRYPV